MREKEVIVEVYFPYVDVMANAWSINMTHSYFLRNLTVQQEKKL